MGNYWQRLKAHPGKRMASGMTLLGGIAGMANDSFSTAGGFMFGASVFGIICWPIVLWTARTQPLPEREGSND